VLSVIRFSVLFFLSSVFYRVCNSIGLAYAESECKTFDRSKRQIIGDGLGECALVYIWIDYISLLSFEHTCMPPELVAIEHL